VRLWFPANLDTETGPDAEDHAGRGSMPKASTLEAASIEHVPEGLS
jgi:hypothetical protein